MSQQTRLRPFVRAMAVGAAIFLAGCTYAETDALDDGAPAQPSTSADNAGAAMTASAAAPVAPPAKESLPAPKILDAGQRLQCVPYARRLSGLPIFGNAATWWLSAYGLYRRSNRPTPDAVMVFRASHRNPFGHLAVVNTVVDTRKILVDHANWLNGGRIHRVTPVIDVSPGNDWSAVRVWYTPGKRLGAHVFPVSGFILPEKLPPGELFRTVANANVRKRPSRKARRVARLPKETTVELLERVAERPWFRVAVNGQEIGYVFAPLVEPVRLDRELL